MAFWFGRSRTVAPVAPRTCDTCAESYAPDKQAFEWVVSGAVAPRCGQCVVVRSATGG